LESKREAEREASRLQRKLAEAEAEVARNANPDAPRKRDNAPQAQARVVQVVSRDNMQDIPEQVIMLGDRLQRANLELKTVTQERDELKRKAQTGEQHLFEEHRRLILENERLKADRVRLESNLNMEVKQLQKFKKEMIQFREKESEKMRIQLEDLSTDKEMMMFQEIDDEKRKNKLQTRLDEALEELRALAGVAQDQERELDQMDVEKYLLERQLGKVMGLPESEMPQPPNPRVSNEY